MSRIWMFGIALLLASLCSAQSQSGTYRIQEEDRLAIAVFDEPQMAAQVVVMPDGNISAPFAGTIRAIGKTTSELETELADIYKSKLRLRNPRVSVTVVSVRANLVTIQGAVGKAGQYAVRPAATVRDLIALGQVDDRLGDTRRATFQRKGWTETIPLDLYSMVATNNLSQNYELKDGDTINVPQKKNSYVRVFGEVYQPKNIPYEEGMDLVTAVTGAGGAIQNRARQSRIVVVRPRPGSTDQYYMIQCSLVAFYKKSDFAQNIKLQPGDTIYVPNNGNINTDILNQVANAVFILDRFGINIFGSGN
ncbi:MAG: polysaccharide biosynthesis/export family protein [Armatimonadetes bacterium]|nr:polysaccharide biosynthesis/export family protein [Armatimonadota bacterium]